MAYLHVDFTVPVIVLASAIASVIVVRALASWSERRAAARTQKLLREHGMTHRDRGFS